MLHANVGDQFMYQHEAETLAAKQGGGNDMDERGQVIPGSQKPKLTRS
jgi:hypothetical protein